MQHPTRVGGIHPSRWGLSCAKELHRTGAQDCTGSWLHPAGHVYDHARVSLLHHRAAGINHTFAGAQGAHPGVLGPVLQRKYTGHSTTNLQPMLLVPSSNHLLVDRRRSRHCMHANIASKRASKTAAAQGNKRGYTRRHAQLLAEPEPCKVLMQHAHTNNSVQSNSRTTAHAVSHNSMSSHNCTHCSTPTPEKHPGHALC